MQCTVYYTSMNKCGLCDKERVDRPSLIKGRGAFIYNIETTSRTKLYNQIGYHGGQVNRNPSIAKSL